MQKKWMQVTGLGLSLCLLLGGCGGEKFATVNGDTISKEAYDARLGLYRNMVTAQYGLANTAEQQLIEQKVMEQDLEKNGIKITDDDEKADYDEMVKGYGGVTAYQQTLQFLDVTDEQMRGMVEYTTVSRLHKKMFNDKNAPSEEDLKKYFEDNKDSLIKVDASHILVETEEEAKKAKARLDQGEKFEDLAKELSTDGSASNGGSLGVQSPSTYVAEFAEAVKNMKDGEVSDPVQSQFGWHIIRVNKQYNTLEAVRDDVVAAVNDPKYQAYLEKLVSDAEVKVEGREESSEEESSGEESEGAESEASEEASAAE